MLSLTWSSKCDQQVEPPSSQSVPNSIRHPNKDTSYRSSPLKPTEVNQQEHLAPTMGPDKTWSHPHSRLSILRDEKHEASTIGIWKKWGPHLETNHGGHEGSQLGKWRIWTRARASSRRSQGKARTAMSRNPSWPRALTGSPYGIEWGLSNNYGRACTSEWGVAQDQRGAVE